MRPAEATTFSTASSVKPAARTTTSYFSGGSGKKRTTPRSSVTPSFAMPPWIPDAFWGRPR